MKRIILTLIFSMAIFVAHAQNEFITTWKTNNTGTSAFNQITIPVYPSETYNFSVDWGDGSFESGLTGETTHTYATAGTYQVSISGTFPGIFFGVSASNDKEKILFVNQWGTNVWRRMNSAFHYCKNLDIVATDVPNLSVVTSTAGMFIFNSKLRGNTSFANWDVSNVTDMNYMFFATQLFNQNISTWDVSNVTDMSDMFRSTSTFNQPIGNWDVSSVSEMDSMFRYATAFNSSLNSWNLESLDTTINMFNGATDFNQNISDWDVSKVRFMAYMFNDAERFNQDISTWNVANVLTMNNVFSGATDFNQDIGSWNVGKVQFMSSMFENAIAFDQDLGTWDIKSITGLTNMFKGATLSTENYDSLLTGWKALPSINNNINFHGGNSKYCESNGDRQELIDTNGWTITDGGDACGFITTWTTDNPGISQNNQITIPTFPGETYNYSVDWGDGEIDFGVTGDITHTYSTIGTYSVSISGVFPRIYHEILDGAVTDAKKIISVDNWGSQKWSSMQKAFAGCENMDMLAVDVPDLSEVTTMENMFSYCYSLNGNSSFGQWNVSNVTNMSALFFSNYLFNQDIGTWNVSNLVEGSGLFAGATAFNQNISSWNVANLQYMGGMFNGASAFNQALNVWDVSNVINFNNTFANTAAFNQDLSNWNVSNAIIFSGMFSEAIAFNQDISNWNVSKALDMAYMFSGTQIFNQNISNWDVGNVKDMFGMFKDATNFNQPIGSWNVSNVTDMRAMFQQANSFNQELNSWDVNQVTDMWGMFDAATAFNQPLNDWDVSNVTNMFGMFADAYSFNQPLDNWNVSSVVDMTNMFLRVPSFDQNLGDWNIGQVANMIDMFKEAGLSKTNYDATLIGWANLSTLQNDVQFDAGSSLYCSGEISKLKLIEDYNWTITDAGKECPFITTWKTDNEGITADNQITIPTSPYETYNYMVDWGDGNIDTGVTGNIIHTYDVAGTYQVSISGVFAQIYFNNYAIGVPQDGDEKKIISVDQWGDLDWRTMKGAFAGCSNLDVLAIDRPNFENLTNISAMFRFCPSLEGNETMADWDIRSIRDISNLFEGASAFNQDIGKWDLGNVEHMGSIFSNATTFNQDIGNWNVSKVKYMSYAFIGAKAFNQDIGRWNVSSTLEQHATFGGAISFNQDISAWDMSNVYRTDAMFSGAESFNQDISGWDVSNVTTMNTMFYGTKAFNQDISDWNVSNVTDMNTMFEESGFDQNLGEWNVSNVTSMQSMFTKAGLSTKNYDSTMIGWAAQTLQPNVEFYGGSSKYCDGESARQIIIDTYGWTINDSGKDANCNIDNDNDGVMDHLDLCLNTPEGSVVNAEGCLELLANNFTIETLGETCPDSNNAQILIESAATIDFIANINGIDYPFTNQLAVEDLSPGMYDVCISNESNFIQQCFALELVGSESISGKSTIENGKMAIQIERGTAPYVVLVNGKNTFETSSKSIDVDVLEGDVVEILTAKVCEGSISESVNLSSSIAYPNPTSGSFEITLPMILTEADIEVFTLQSQLVSKKSYPVIGGKVLMDIKNLPSGMYMVKVNMENSKMFKIVKQ